MNGESSHPVLAASALSKAFTTPTGAIEVLRGVDLTIRAAESISIRGESGSGKSTLLNLLAGLECPDAGRVEWNGRPIESSGNQGWIARQRGRFLGMVFQAYYLVPEMNALDNVLLAGRIGGYRGAKARSRAQELLGRVGLGSRERSAVNKLSGGERQRVAVARALMNRPRIVLADEPTGNLDEKTSAPVVELLLGICGEEAASLILVTHNPTFAARADRAFHLREGTLHPDGGSL